MKLSKNYRRWVCFPIDIILALFLLVVVGLGMSLCWLGDMLKSVDNKPAKWYDRLCKWKKEND